MFCTLHTRLFLKIFLDRRIILENGEEINLFKDSRILPLVLRGRESPLLSWKSYFIVLGNVCYTAVSGAKLQGKKKKDML